MKLPNSDLNFAVDFCVDSLLFPSKKAPKNPPKNPPGNLFGKIPIGFLQKPFLEKFAPESSILLTFEPLFGSSWGQFRGYFWGRPREPLFSHFRVTFHSSGLQGPAAFSLCPNLLFLAFLVFLAFFLFKEFLAILSVFPFFPKDFRGSASRRNPCLFGGFPCCFPKRQGKEDQGVLVWFSPPTIFGALQKRSAEGCFPDLF